MSNGIDIEEMATAIKKQLNDYNEDVDKATKLAVAKVARETNKVIKANVKFNSTASTPTVKKYAMIKINGRTKRVAIKSGRSTGEYVKAFKVKTIEESLGIHSKTWYVRYPYYTLTHLLEDGHKYNVNGKSGNSKAYPHIKFGEEYAIKQLPIEIEKRIKKIK
jgi:hypothetical protein